ncbi:hypothetical protein OIU85_030325 [Salix viminalis]|uniref:Uncharacterized protein n=1 Tax=Salix viminalis TaxID=40686 RepID=A0A9Q0QDL0_SALVM|nr:hypothetical protein OIU85_030325 [Salix viminalis]
MEFLFQTAKRCVVNHLAKNSSVSSTLPYWLVNNPTILNFSWNQGQTVGASPLFLAVTVLSYLSLTFILSHATLPSVGPRTLRFLTAMHNILLLSLLHHGHRLRPLRRLPRTQCGPRRLLPRQHPAGRATLLLVACFLSLEDFRVHGHSPDHLEQLHQKADFSPRLSPCNRRGHVLPISPHFAVFFSRGSCRKLVGACYNVFLLLPVRGREASQVEKVCHRLPDCAVLFELRDHGLDFLPPFHRSGLLRHLGVVLRRGVHHLSSGSVP